MDRTNLLKDNPQKFGGRTLATLVIDRSGSMGSVRDDTIGGINQWKGDVSASNPETRVTIVQFDHEYEVLYENVPIGDVPDFTTETYVPRGATALLDAVNKALMLTDRGLTNQDRALFVVVTDGQENASNEVREATTIRSMIQDREQKGNYTFLFLNSSPDQFLSQRLGFDAGNTFVYAGSSPEAATQAFNTLSRVSSNYSNSPLRSMRNAFVEQEDDDSTNSTSTTTGTGQVEN